jgi:hypothetical protein
LSRNASTMVERHTAINEKYGIDHGRGIERNIGISRWVKGNVNIAEKKEKNRGRVGSK